MKRNPAESAFNNLLILNSVFFSFSFIYLFIFLKGSCWVLYFPSVLNFLFYSRSVCLVQAVWFIIYLLIWVKREKKRWIFSHRISPLLDTVGYAACNFFFFFFCSWKDQRSSTSWTCSRGRLISALVRLDWHCGAVHCQQGKMINLLMTCRTSYSKISKNRTNKQKKK